MVLDESLSKWVMGDMGLLLEMDHMTFLKKEPNTIGQIETFEKLRG